MMKFILAALLALVPNLAQAAASTQVTHAWLCAPEPSVGAPGPRRVVNTSSTATPQPSYTLNAQGCALFASADVGFFLSQGYTYGVNEAVQQQNAITSSGTTSVTTTIVLPPYAFIKFIVIEETAGNAVTGGVNIGDSGSATQFVSAKAVGANANVVFVPTNLTPNASASTPTSDTVLINAATSWNSASLNLSVIYGYW